MINPPKTLEEAKAYKYGVWAGRPEGSRYRENRCAHKVWLKGEWYSRQCGKKPGHGPAGLYCRLHAKMVEER